MKKTFRILALIMTMVILSLSVAGCSKFVTGKYVANIGGIETSYEFSTHNKVTRIIGAGGYSYTEEGTYEIIENEENTGELVIKFTFDGDTEIYPFSQGKENGVKYIKIDGWKFEKE